MGNGVSIDQGNLPSYGIRDVSDAADRKQHDWSQLAEAPIIEQPSSALWSPQDSYSDARNVGPKSSSFINGNEHMGTNYIGARTWDLKSPKSTDDVMQFGTYDDTANMERRSSDGIDAQLDIYSDALSSVMGDDSGYITRLSAWESAESANNNQLRQRRRQLGSSSSEDGEVRAEVNGHREGRKKSTTSTETELPESTNTHADASARPASGRAAACHTEERISTRQLKSTNTYDDASTQPIFGCVAAHHTEERTAIKRLAPLQLVPTRNTPSLTNMMLPDRTSAEEQQSLESSVKEEQPRRVSAKEIGQELAEIRRLGRLAKDLDRQCDQHDGAAIRVSDIESGFYFNRHVGVVEPLTGATFEQADQPEVRFYGQQGDAHGACPNKAGLYGLLGNAGSAKPNGILKIPRSEANLDDRSDSAYNAYPDNRQQSLTDAKMVEVNKVLQEQALERTTDGT